MPKYFKKAKKAKPSSNIKFQIWILAFGIHLE